MIKEGVWDCFSQENPSDESNTPTKIGVNIDCSTHYHYNVREEESSQRPTVQKTQLLRKVKRDLRLNKSFFGRRVLLDRLQEIFLSSEKANSNYSCSFVLQYLHGPSGIGKTQIAKQFAVEQQFSHYRFIAWINWEPYEKRMKELRWLGNEIVEKGLAGITNNDRDRLNKEKTDEESLKSIIQALLESTSDYLIVLDDVKKMKDIGDLLPGGQNHARHFLVTTHNPYFEPHQLNAHKVSGLEPEASHQLIKNQYLRSPFESHEEIELFAFTLGRYPIVLTQAILHLNKSNRLNLKKYRKEFKRSIALWEKDEEKRIVHENTEFDGYEHTFHTVMDLNVKDLRQVKWGIEACQLWQPLAFLYHESIEVEWFDLYASYISLQKSCVDDALEQLLSWGLLEKEFSIQGLASYRLHEMIQVYLNFRLKREEASFSIYSNIIMACLEYIKEKGQGGCFQSSFTILHIKQLLYHSEEFPNNLMDNCNSKDKQAPFLELLIQVCLITVYGLTTRYAFTFSPSEWHFIFEKLDILIGRVKETNKNFWKEIFPYQLSLKLSFFREIENIQACKAILEELSTLLLEGSVPDEHASSVGNSMLCTYEYLYNYTQIEYFFEEYYRYQPLLSNKEDTKNFTKLQLETIKKHLTDPHASEDRALLSLSLREVKTLVLGFEVEVEEDFTIYRLMADIFHGLIEKNLGNINSKENYLESKSQCQKLLKVLFSLNDKLMNKVTLITNSPTANEVMISIYILLLDLKFMQSRVKEFYGNQRMQLCCEQLIDYSKEIYKYWKRRKNKQGDFDYFIKIAFQYASFLATYGEKEQAYKVFENEISNRSFSRESCVLYYHTLVSLFCSPNENEHCCSLSLSDSFNFRLCAFSIAKDLFEFTELSSLKRLTDQLKERCIDMVDKVLEILAHTENYEEARAFIDKRLLLSSELSSVVSLKSDLNRGTLRLEEKIDTYLRLLQLEPFDVKLRRNLAQLCFIRYCQLESHKDLYSKGLVGHIERHFEEVLILCNLTAEYSPLNALAEYANFEYRLGNFDFAFALAQKAWNIKPAVVDGGLSYDGLSYDKEEQIIFDSFLSNIINKTAVERLFLHPAALVSHILISIYFSREDKDSVKTILHVLMELPFFNEKESKLADEQRFREAMIADYLTLFNADKESLFLENLLSHPGSFSQAAVESSNPFISFTYLEESESVETPSKGYISYPKSSDGDCVYNNFSIQGEDAFHSNPHNEAYFNTLEASKISAEKEGSVGLRKIRGWTLDDLGDDGNCFYYAVCQQLEGLNHSFILEVPEGTCASDSLRLSLQGENFKDGEWADYQEIFKLVKKFEVIVAIVDTRYPERGYRYYYPDFSDIENSVKDTSIENELPSGFSKVRLAFTGNHYLSVIQDPYGFAFQKCTNHEENPEEEKIALHKTQVNRGSFFKDEQHQSLDEDRNTNSEQSTIYAKMIDSDFFNDFSDDFDDSDLSF